MPKEIIVNCLGETCPVPLVETRKAVRKANKGDMLVIKGDHSASKKEIPMAVKAMGLNLVSVEEKNNSWEIKIEV